MHSCRLPHKKAQEVSHIYAQNKAQKDQPWRISWQLVAISNETHKLHNGARLQLAKERRKERKKERKEGEQLWVLVYHFINSCYTADWGRLYKLLYILLDVSICSLVIILCYGYVNTLIGFAILFSWPSLHMDYTAYTGVKKKQSVYNDRNDRSVTMCVIAVIDQRIGEFVSTLQSNTYIQLTCYSYTY